MKIVKEYLLDKRTKVMNDENVGVSSVRNLGLKNNITNNLKRESIKAVKSKKIYIKRSIKDKIDNNSSRNIQDYIQ